MNPFLGVFFHWLGGLASGSFYVSCKGVKKIVMENLLLHMASIIVIGYGTYLKGGGGH